MTGTDSSHEQTSSWQRLLEWPQSKGHLVQLYRADERLLTSNVARYLWEGWKRGDGLLVIADASRRRAVARQLHQAGADTDDAIRERRLAFIDVHEALERFVVDGQPRWERFAATVGAAVRDIQQRVTHAGLRVYSEMAGVLWKLRQSPAAARVEEFWNTLIHSSGCKLYCAYPIDVLDKEFHLASVDALLCAHTHLLPAPDNEHLASALNRAMDEILGPRAEGLRLLMKGNYRPSWAVMPKAEGIILWLRNNLHEIGEEILARARQYYRDSRYIERPV